MSEQFERRMRPLSSRMEHEQQRELANIRQWYYSVSEAERATFKRNVQSLIEASKPFDRSTSFSLLLSFCWTWHHEDESISMTADRSPQEILDAIDEWDAADEKEWTIV